MPRLTRNAFTLLELLLAMAIFAAMAAIVIPAAGSLMSDRRLTRATDQLRAELTRIRVRAMREGRVLVVQTTAGGNTVAVTAMFSAADATEALDQTGSQSSLMSGAEQTMASVGTLAGSTTAGGRTIELPTGVQVQTVLTSPVGGQGSIEPASMAMAASMETLAPMEVVDETAGAALPPIYFYPNGTTSNAILALTHPEAGSASIRLRGLTGDVSAQVDSP